MSNKEYKIRARVKKRQQRIECLSLKYAQSRRNHTKEQLNRWNQKHKERLSRHIAYDWSKQRSRYYYKLWRLSPEFCYTYKFKCRGRSKPYPQWRYSHTEKHPTSTSKGQARDYNHKFDKFEKYFPKFKLRTSE